jgi:hypothetical protein
LVAVSAQRREMKWPWKYLVGSWTRQIASITSPGLARMTKLRLVSFVDTKELHDGARIGKVCFGNGSDGKLFEGVHDVRFLVIIRHKTLSECILG